MVISHKENNELPSSTVRDINGTGAGAEGGIGRVVFSCGVLCTLTEGLLAFPLGDCPLISSPAFNPAAFPFLPPSFLF